MRDDGEDSVLLIRKNGGQLLTEKVAWQTPVVTKLQVRETLGGPSPKNNENKNFHLS